MFRPFTREVGHLALDDARIATVVASRQAMASNIAQEAQIQGSALERVDHLELREGVADETQGIGEAQAIGVDIGIQSGGVHDGSNSRMGNEIGAQADDHLQVFYRESDADKGDRSRHRT